MAFRTEMGSRLEPPEHGTTRSGLLPSSSLSAQCILTGPPLPLSANTLSLLLWYWRMHDCRQLQALDCQGHGDGTGSAQHVRASLLGPVTAIRILLGHGGCSWLPWRSYCLHTQSYMSAPKLRARLFLHHQGSRLGLCCPVLSPRTDHRVSGPTAALPQRVDMNSDSKTSQDLGGTAGSSPL